MIEIGEKIDGRYRITGRIAHGGMADIYEAYDVIGRRRVAIKVMRIDMMKDKSNIERFQRECIAAASLNNPNVVKVYGQGIIDDRPYMVNEYVSGRTLRDKLNLDTTHHFSPQEACEIMIQLTSGIQYVHEHGIIHRDIKPDNLFYMPDGSIKISDFGISTELGETPKGDAVPGTVYYCAPEVLMGQKAGIPSDIYSLGIVFFEILTGTIPFDGNTPEDIALAQIKKPMPDPSKILSSVPKALDKIVLKACRKRPEERYESALLMHDAIINALKNGKDFTEKKGFFARLLGLK